MNGIRSSSQVVTISVSKLKQEEKKELNFKKKKIYLFCGISWLSFTKPYPVLFVVWLWEACRGVP